MTDSESPPRRRAKHLIDFDNPPPPSRSRGMSLTHVQMWVMSVLAVSTGLHFSLGLVAAAYYIQDSRPDSRIGLLVLAGIMGVASCMAGAAIHRKSVLTWWVHLGWLPALVGAWFLFRG